MLGVATALRVDVCCFCVAAPGMKRGNSGVSLDSGVVSAFCFSFLILVSSDIGLRCSEFNSVKVLSPLSYLLLTMFVVKTSFLLKEKKKDAFFDF